MFINPKNIILFRFSSFFYCKDKGMLSQIMGHGKEK